MLDILTDERSKIYEQNGNTSKDKLREEMGIKIPKVKNLVFFFLNKKEFPLPQYTNSNQLSDTAMPYQSDC